MADLLARMKKAASLRRLTKEFVTGPACRTSPITCGDLSKLIAVVEAARDQWMAADSDESAAAYNRMCVALKAIEEDAAP